MSRLRRVSQAAGITLTLSPPYAFSFFQWKLLRQARQPRPRSAGSALRSDALARDKHRFIPFSRSNNNSGSPTDESYFADFRCRYANGVEGGAYPINRVSRHRNQQTARGLWIEKRTQQFHGETARRRSFPQNLAIWKQALRERFCATRGNNTFRPWHLSSFHRQGHVARHRHFLVCPIRPNPVRSKRRAHGTPAGMSCRASEAARFNVRIERTAWSATAAGTRSNLIAVPTMPVPIGLVRKSASPGFAPAFVRIRAGSATRNRVSKLDLRILYGHGPPSRTTPASRNLSNPPRKIWRSVP